MKISTKYSGLSGIYVCLSVIKGSRSLLAPVQELGATDLTDLHCTLMYSRGIPVPQIRAYTMNAAAPSVFDANVLSVEFWDGHDNDGYLVAQLHAPSVVDRHVAWKRAGAVHSFEQYTPHITLLSKMDKPSKKMMSFLDSSLAGLPIKLGAEHIEDIKGT